MNERDVLAALGRIERKVDAIVAVLPVLYFKEVQVAGELDKLEADVAAQATVIDSAVALLGGLKAALDAAIASGDPARLTALSSEIETKTAALSTAVTTNTPASP